MLTSVINIYLLEFAATVNNSLYLSSIDNILADIL